MEDSTYSAIPRCLESFILPLQDPLLADLLKQKSFIPLTEEYPVS